MNESLTETQSYWRDALMKHFGWGVATMIVLSGWALMNGQELNYKDVSEGEYAAVLLTVFTFVIGVVWLVAGYRAWARSGDGLLHPTVLRPSEVHFGLWFVFTTTLTISILVGGL